MSRGKIAHPTSRTIRIDQEVYEWLQSKATPFKDGPNNVLRRLMDKDPAYRAKKTIAVGGEQQKEAS